MVCRGLVERLLSATYVPPCPRSCAKHVCRASRLVMRVVSLYQDLKAHDFPELPVPVLYYMLFTGRPSRPSHFSESWVSSCLSPVEQQPERTVRHRKEWR